VGIPPASLLRPEARTDASTRSADCCSGSPDLSARLHYTGIRGRGYTGHGAIKRFGDVKMVVYVRDLEHYPE
jgi:hypothetical protein